MPAILMNSLSATARRKLYAQSKATSSSSSSYSSSSTSTPLPRTRAAAVAGQIPEGTSASRRSSASSSTGSTSGNSSVSTSNRMSNTPARRRIGWSESAKLWGKEVPASEASGTWGQFIDFSS